MKKQLLRIIAIFVLAASVKASEDVIIQRSIVGEFDLDSSKNWNFCELRALEQFNRQIESVKSGGYNIILSKVACSDRLLQEKNRIFLVALNSGELSSLGAVSFCDLKVSQWMVEFLINILKSSKLPKLKSIFFSGAGVNYETASKMIELAEILMDRCYDLKPPFHCSLSRICSDLSDEQMDELNDKLGYEAFFRRAW